MQRTVVHADQQICIRALQAIALELKTAAGRRELILKVAASALRQSSRRRLACNQCPYGGRCGSPLSVAVLEMAPDCPHVPIKWPDGYPTIRQ